MDVINKNFVDDSDDDEEEEFLTIVGFYISMEDNSLFKSTPQPQRISKLKGHAWVVEVLTGHPRNCYDTFRMTPPQFIKLCDLLKERNKLKDTRFLSVQEQVAIFLLIICQIVRTRFAADRFQHSGYTIHRHFKRVLKAICSLSKYFIVPPSFDEVAQEIRFNPRYYPFFKHCVGAIDGTHISACIPKDEQIPYCGRKIDPTINMMCCCSFDMKFTFVMAGWEGTANDSRIFLETIYKAENRFPFPPTGKYYIVDSGYANMPGFLSPYRGERYHLRDYRGQRAPQGPKELFNYIHSSLRNVIERCFGVLKARFPILKFMLPYALKRQKYIPLACCVLHNFIKMEMQDDPLFTQYADENVQLEDEAANGNNNTEEHVPPQVTTASFRQMATFRDRLAQRLWDATNATL
ncbi:protein ANTAGONIST OF LIKE HETEROCHROMATIN PROTEIN 1-like isoform X1 [Lotus japonicus]|uniref:protein ANTAGONIST OF LIKE HETEROCHROMATIN PROTEIN 1-like isoform X1 n=1 Tax=Lotus japonicus TaxID=34305 RepID=UPI002583E3D0|nr:protein ANTAGONIST OF LIKE HETEROCHROMATIN PROTEIN 1-like isoform X1 [Lotus japonicus]